MTKLLLKLKLLICPFVNTGRKFLFILKNKKTIEENNFILLVNTPEHDNIGDASIAVAEILFLEKHLDKKIIEVAENQYKYLIEYLKHNVSKDVPILLHGGGNMGDEYFFFESMTRDYITAFPDNKIIIMPQTIYYTSTEFGQNEKQNSIAIYNNHKNLIICAREKISYEMMKDLYPNVKVFLVPDIVLTLPTYDKHFERNGALLCLRKDKEGILKEEDNKSIVETLVNNGFSIKFTDMMHTADKIKKDKRTAIVEAKMNEFCRAKVIVTDRLHGMIFCAITNTPCLVLSNYNQKVSGVYNWLKDNENIKITTMETFENDLESLISLAKNRNKHSYHSLDKDILIHLENELKCNR